MALRISATCWSVMPDDAGRFAVVLATSPSGSDWPEGEVSSITTEGNVCSDFCGGTKALSIAGAVATAAGELDLAKSGLLHAGEATEGVVKIFGVVAGEATPSGEDAVPGFSVDAAAVSFFGNQAGEATGEVAPARAAEVFAALFPFAAPRSASNSSRGAKRPA